MRLHEVLVSDLCRLPTEVLCHIFIHCLPQAGYTLPNSKSPPMLLTRICRRWREIATDMPSLWCRLSMDINHATSRNWRQAVFCYDLWFKRTQGRPLSLEIMCIKNDTTDLRTLFQPYVSQISSLKITFDKAVAPEILLNDLPALQELRVDISHDVVVKDRNILACILPPISRLFTLRGLKLETLSPYDIARLNPAWPLTNVNLDICDPSTIIGLLRLFFNLSSLKIYMLFDDGSPLEPFTHSTIQFFSITFVVTTLMPSVRDQLVHLFDALTLPNLRVLHVEGRSWPRVEDLILQYGK
ncbi:hypothetical protein DFJ58DRAFT_402749 [Suillus subalutaceus]|uniref:uncharacterized protein n=1 Tax=Suillus subalutaceus TaxID=48586 RepID=UPI001B872248|nr:uncharacterized protein DFJ58DRAFT_402749 [Suillus subalutaceus]KAG1852796.1 hypothetical protein DFJ58DRAFT_402749 [Suillus subalutaceus]